jgi:hypothetical protein
MLSQLLNIETFSPFFFTLPKKKTHKPIVLFNLFLFLVCALQLGDVLKFNNFFFLKSALLVLGGL